MKLRAGVMLGATLAVAGGISQPRLPARPTLPEPKPAESPLFISLKRAAETLRPAPTRAAHPKFGFVLRSSVAVDGKPGELEIYALPADRMAIMVLKSAPIPKAASITRDNLWRILIESGEYSPAHVAYNLNERRFEFRTPIAPADVSPASLQRELARLQNMAKVTKAIWRS